MEFLERKHRRKINAFDSSYWFFLGFNFYRSVFKYYILSALNLSLNLSFSFSLSLARTLSLSLSISTSFPLLVLFQRLLLPVTDISMGCSLWPPAVLWELFWSCFSSCLSKATEFGVWKHNLNQHGPRRPSTHLNKTFNDLHFIHNVSVVEDTLHLNKIILNSTSNEKVCSNRDDTENYISYLGFLFSIMEKTTTKPKKNHIHSF